MLLLLGQPLTENSPQSKTKRIISYIREETSRAAHTADPYNHLIIVPGHSVLNIDNAAFRSAGEEDGAWKLLDYQEKQGLPAIISSHISSAINISRNDMKSILLFSGGETRLDAGPISEGLSYYIFSKRSGWIGGSLEGRVYVEEYARDSFENLLFSLCRFREITGQYPERVTIVGFDFKQHRYETLHREAVDFPVDLFTYVGLRPASADFDHEAAAAGELKTVTAFQQNMYGCDAAPQSAVAIKPSLRGAHFPQRGVKNNSEPSSSEIVAKRRARNPYQRSVPYELSCPEMAPLLRWCGPGLFNDDPFRRSSLPWALKVSA